MRPSFDLKELDVAHASIRAEEAVQILVGRDVPLPAHCQYLPHTASACRRRSGGSAQILSGAKQGEDCGPQRFLMKRSLRKVRTRNDQPHSCRWVQARWLVPFVIAIIAGIGVGSSICPIAGAIGSRSWKSSASAISNSTGSAGLLAYPQKRKAVVSSADGERHYGGFSALSRLVLRVRKNA